MRMRNSKGVMEYVICNNGVNDDDVTGTINYLG